MSNIRSHGGREVPETIEAVIRYVMPVSFVMG